MKSLCDLIKEAEDAIEAHSSLPWWSSFFNTSRYQKSEAVLIDKLHALQEKVSDIDEGKERPYAEQVMHLARLVLREGYAELVG